MKDLIIIGASGFGREVAWLIERINAVKPTWNIIGFVDDNEGIWNTEVGGYKVLGGSKAVASFSAVYYICAVGAAKTRKAIIDSVETVLPAIKYATLIDPTVMISDRAKIGNGCIICAGSIITVDIEIGNHVIVNLDCTIGHDAVIADFVTLYPSVNVSGKTNVGECAELGTGVQIIQGKAIGEDTIVGAGAVVVKDLPAKCTAVGSPAKPIKFHE